MDERLTKLQWVFLEKHIRKSKMDYYRGQKVALKGKFITDIQDLKEIDAQLDEWVLWEVLHGDEGTKPFQCHCGKRVRHLYVVEHRAKDVTMKLGSTCYKKYVDIDVKKVEKVMKFNEILNAEIEEIIDRYEVGYIQKQYFLLDYTDLAPLFREQLLLMLPLSEKQENRAYRELGIENEDQLVKRKDLIKMLGDDQLVKLNSLTSEARQTIIARLVDGRILGVLDDVLNAAPEIFADRNPLDVHVPNRLEDRLVHSFQEADKTDLIELRRAHSRDIAKLIRMVDTGILPSTHLVVVGRELLNNQQREYWGGHTSSKQKIEIAKHLLEGTNVVRRSEIDGWQALPKKAKDLIELGIPLTHQMMVDVT